MFFRSKERNDEKMRMAVETSSLFVPIGRFFRITDPKEGARVIREHGSCAVVFIPSLSVLASPRAWTSALSSASSLIVIGDGSLAPYKAFMRLLDNIIFSPVPRKLSSSFITSDRGRAEEILSGISGTIDTVITISSLES